MLEVYFYIPAKNVENAVECGLKLSEWFSKEVEINGDKRKCISALLNPRDDLNKYMSDEFKCVKLEVMLKYCYIADAALYKTGLAVPEVMKMYEQTVIPADKYNFGKYRLPECLVTSTIVGEGISVLDKRLDSPVLFNRSEELYVDSITESFKEKYDDFGDAMLYSFYSKLSDVKRLQKVEDVTNGIAIFYDEKDKTVYTARIPNMEIY